MQGLKWFIAVSLITLSFMARGEDWLEVSLYSYHFAGSASLAQPCGRNQSVTNCTLGLGWEHDLGHNLRSILHAYSNSHGNLSMDADLTWTPIKFADGAGFGVLLGQVTGYKNNPLSPTLFGALTFSYERRGHGMNAIFIPASGGVLHLQYKEAVKFME